MNDRLLSNNIYKVNVDCRKSSSFLNGSFEMAAVFELSLCHDGERLRDIMAHIEYLLGRIRRNTIIAALDRLHARGWLEKNHPRVIAHRRPRGLSEPQEQPYYTYYRLKTELPGVLIVSLTHLAARYFGFKDYYELSSIPYNDAMQNARAFHSFRSEGTKKDTVTHGKRRQVAISENRDGRYRISAPCEEGAVISSMCRAAQHLGPFCRTTQRMIRKYAKQEFINDKKRVEDTPFTEGELREAVEASRKSLSTAPHQ